MPQYKIHFSIEEARALLPELRERLMAMRDLVAQIRAEQAESAQDRLRIMRGNGKGPILEGVNPRIADLQRQIDEIVKMGVQIKDIDRGLIDFPHYLNGNGGREVFLCYEMSDPDIEFWHEIDSGYSDRQPL